MNILPKISVPSYRMDVPSTGQNIEYRPYLVKEEKLLLIAIASEDTTQIQNAILNIIKECTDVTDINALITSDLEMIFLNLRIVSVGAKVEIITPCQHCEEENNYAIDLSKIVIENKKTKKDLRVDVDKNFIIDMIYPSFDNKVESEDNLINTVASCIETIYYGEDTFSMDGVSSQERVNFVGDLTSSQFAKLVKVLMDAPFVSYSDTYACKKCKKENDVYYTGLIDFFI